MPGHHKACQIGSSEQQVLLQHMSLLCSCHVQSYALHDPYCVPSYVLYVPNIFYVPYSPSYFLYVPYVFQVPPMNPECPPMSPQCLLCLLCPFYAPLCPLCLLCLLYPSYVQMSTFVPKSLLRSFLYPHVPPMSLPMFPCSLFLSPMPH